VNDGRVLPSRLSYHLRPLPLRFGVFIEVIIVPTRPPRVTHLAFPSHIEPSSCYLHPPRSILPSGVTEHHSGPGRLTKGVHSLLFSCWLPWPLHVHKHLQNDTISPSGFTLDIPCSLCWAESPLSHRTTTPPAVRGWCTQNVSVGSLEDAPQ
jgi:hypothetical protein